MAKTPVPEFYGTIRGKSGVNRIELDGTHWYRRYVNTAFKEGQRVKVIVKRYYRQRTTGREDLGEEGNQNGYLYAVVLPMISEATGYSVEEACTALETLLCSDIADEHGLKRIKRFKNMTTVEFNEHVIDAANPNSVRSWALRVLELDIPEPDKNYAAKGCGAYYQ